MLLLLQPHARGRGTYCIIKLLSHHYIVRQTLGVYYVANEESYSALLFYDRSCDGKIELLGSIPFVEVDP